MTNPPARPKSADQKKKPARTWTPNPYTNHKNKTKEKDIYHSVSKTLAAILNNQQSLRQALYANTKKEHAKVTRIVRGVLLLFSTLQKVEAENEPRKKDGNRTGGMKNSKKRNREAMEDQAVEYGRTNALKSQNGTAEKNDYTIEYLTRLAITHDFLFASKSHTMHLRNKTLSDANKEFVDSITPANDNKQYQTLLSKHKANSRSELVAILTEANSKLLQTFPVYARVNTIKTSTAAVTQQLIKQGYKQVQLGTKSTQSNILEVKHFALDPDIDDLLVLPPSSDLHANPLYLKHQIVIQDKASCIPAYILDPSPGGNCIDACAAPGNKTQHMSCVAKNTGTIYAFDLDNRRLDMLRSNMTKYGSSTVVAKHQSFLDTDPQNKTYADVTHVLADPSCSGSGMHLGRIEGIPLLNVQKSDKGDQRLQKLADFQLSILNHATRCMYQSLTKHETRRTNVFDSPGR